MFFRKFKSPSKKNIFQKNLEELPKFKSDRIVSSYGFVSNLHSKPYENLG